MPTGIIFAAIFTLVCEISLSVGALEGKEDVKAYKVNYLIITIVELISPSPHHKRLSFDHKSFNPSFWKSKSLARVDNHQSPFINFTPLLLMLSQRKIYKLMYKKSRKNKTVKSSTR